MVKSTKLRHHADPLIKRPLPNKLGRAVQVKICRQEQLCGWQLRALPYVFLPLGRAALKTCA